MAEIILAHMDGATVFVRDTDGDGILDVGERIGVRGGDDVVSFDETRVKEALEKVTVSYPIPGNRLTQIAAYVETIRETERHIAAGRFPQAFDSLQRARVLAGSGSAFSVDVSRYAELAWRVVDAAGPSSLGLSDEDLSTLRSNPDPNARAGDAELVLNYLYSRIIQPNRGSKYAEDDAIMADSLGRTIEERARLCRDPEWHQLRARMRAWSEGS